MSNATPHSPSAPANKAARSFSRFVRTSVRPVVFKLSRKLSVTYWPGRRRTISAMLLALLSGFVPGLAGAAPTGSAVVAGSANVLKPTSTTTQINQTSQNVIINWQSFSIGAGEAVRFVQPSASAVALNRVIGSDPSRIFGTLQANGKVFLVNNAGVYFAPGASVDVGGLVATSMNINNASFLSGKYKFEAGAGAGEVANYGQLRGAFVMLAAPQVTNAGSIVTTGGTTALAAGGRVSLDIAGDKLVTMSVDAATANAAVVNSGSVSADGGKVFMSANSANAVLDTVINTSGIVRAGSIAVRNGQIVLDGGAAGVVKVSGTLAASGAGAGLGGGAVTVLGDKVALVNGASIDVSGDTGGGTALVGGDLHGAGGVKTAAFTQVDAGAVINADALTGGNGGKVVVWADQHTGFGGAISARGGAQGGDGGFVETSGKATLAFAGKVNTTAAHGATGNLLLDPTDITISTGATANAGLAASTLNVTDLTTALGSTNVTVDTASAAASAGNIVVATDVNWASTNSLTLKASGDITNNAQINGNGGGAINLNGDGVINAGTLSSAGGAVSIAGSAGGSSRAGSVIGTSIASAGGSVNIRSAGAVSTGAINAGSGTISIDGNAGVAITGALATSNSGASAIFVNAGASHSGGDGSGGDITVAGGSVAVGAGGFATLYTGSIAGSTGLTAAVGAGSGNFRYNSDGTIGNFNAALTPGVSAVYREQPTLTIGVNSASTTYGDALPSFIPTFSGLQNGDATGQALASAPSVSVGGAFSGSGNKTAGTHAVALSLVPAAEQLGYGVTFVDGALTVAKKALTSSGSTAAGKTYDGTTAATVNTSTTTFGSGGANSGDGLAYSGDVVSVDNAAVTSGVFADKNAAVGKAVTINGITLQGADAGNYTITGNATATIAPKALTATATAADKVYDGTTTATTALTLSGLVGTEQLGVSGTGTFNSKDVVAANTVTVDSVTLADGANGGLAGNYTLGIAQTATAHITPKALTASVTAPDKVYDGDTTAAPVLTASGFVGTETVVATGTGSFNTKDVATANQVTVDSVALADGINGGLATNYSLAASLTGTAHITPKTLTATATAADKAYDGSLAATAVMTIDPAGMVGTETVTGTGAGTFNTKDVLTANLVTVNTVTLADGANGGLGSNYSVSGGQTAAANITPKALSATIASADKVYDGTTTASPTFSVTGLAGTEQLVVTATAAFNSKDVVTANQVTVQSVALADGANGGMASNYDLSSGQTATAHITPKALTATATAADKVYDGSVAAAASLSIASGLVGGETVTATGSGAFNSKDVLAANQVTVNSVVLADGANGGLASNYDLATGQTATAHITPKALTATVANADKAYDGGINATAAMNMAGLVGTEVVTGTGTGTFDSKDVLTASQVTVDTVVLSDGANGGLASNYSTSAGQVASAHIAPKSLTATASAADKVYDGNTAAATTLSIASGLVGAETVAVTGSGAFNSKDVLTANQVTVNSVALADGANGGLASNYQLATGQSAAANITPKALTATVAAADKTYDGNTTASAVMNVAGLVGAETVTATGNGTFDSKDVVTASQVTVSAVTLADGANGGLASNYSASAGQSATAHITPKALTVTMSASDKVYDGNTDASGSLNVASGLVNTETVDVNGSGVFNSKDVLSANLVTMTSLSLADGTNGGLASNYSAAPGQTATAHITPRALTATAAAADKAYDGSLAASAVMNIDAAGLVGTETVTGTGIGVFDSKDVVTASVVTVNAVTLADGANGGLASNYMLGTGQTGSAHITPKALTATATAFDKVYDGNTDAAATLAIASGLVAGETVTATATGAFDTKDVATASTVTVQSVALADGAGGLASNYSLGTGQNAAAHITPKALTAVATAADKVYDGGLGATAVMTIDAAGLVGTEIVTGTGTGTFNTKDVLSANLVTVDTVTLANGANGGLASNYSLGTGQTSAANITPKALAAGVTATDKVYDGNTDAAPTLGITAGLVGTETLGVTGSATFNTKDVLTANLVTVNAVTLADGANGGLASNYVLGAGQSATAHITPKALTATAAAPDKTYDGNMVGAPTVSIASGLVGAETVTASATGTFNSKDVLDANLVTVQAVTLADGAAGGLASNYSLVAGQTAAAHITPKALTATAAAADKVYDGDQSATAVMNIAAGLVGTETVTGTGTGIFNSKDVLAANLVTVQAVTLADGANGGLASNYSLGTGQTGTAHITPKALTATAIAPDKVYDGNPGAAPALSIATGLVGAETLGVSGTGTFNSKDVLAANLVTVNAVALADGANGGIASNYSLAAGQTAVAHVTPKALAATVTASGKVYDGTTTAANVLTIASGLVGAETVSATGSAVFNSKDVLAANQVTVQAATLADGANGGLASNYSLAPGQVASNVHITAKPLTAVALAADKVYDGNLNGTAVMSIAGAGLVGSETVFGSGTGLFNSKDVGSATTVLINSVQLSDGANGGLASNYSLGSGQSGAAKITRRPSVTWIGAAGGNWADAVNWEFGAIPDLANVANVIIPAGKSVTFTASVPSQKGAVQLDSIDGAGALVVSSGTLNVANALKIGSYAQSAGEVDASALSAASNFNQTGGKLVVTDKVDIVQSGGIASLADISAAKLSISGSGATQTASGTLLISDTVTLDTGAGDVLLGNKKNDFGKVVIASAHDVTLSDISALEVNGTVSGTLRTSSDTLTVGPTTVGGNFIASALGAISQTGALDVTGSTIVDSGGMLRLDDKKNALRGRVKVTGGADVLLASAGGLTIGGDVGGKLVLTASGPVIQSVGDALHVKGSSSIDAGAGAVTLTEADNHFTGPLSVKGGALSVVDKGALALGESSVAGNLSIRSGGALTQTGKLNVTGTSAIAAKGQAVTLGDAGNTFGGKMTLGAASATVNAAGALTLDSDVDGSLTLGSTDLKLNAANALNLHLNTGAAAISAPKAVSIDGSATGPLTVSAGGAVTQGGALVAGGTTSISAPGQAITLTNAGNDFGGELSLAGAATQVTDKNALTLGSGAIGGDLQLTAKGDITQKGALNVSGTTAIDSTGAVVLGNEGNDFVGPVSATASSIMLRDKNVLTLRRLTASKVELSAGSELQVAPGGIVDSPDISLSLSPTAVKGAIGTPVNKFEVRKGARIVLGANSPAVPTYISGDGAQVVVGNLAASINYSNEAWSMDARTRVNSSIANILQATQKKADSNAVLIERGLPTDLTVPIPYPHEGAMRTKAPDCDDKREICD